jgi:hypothetical protein
MTRERTQISMTLERKDRRSRVKGKKVSEVKLIHEKGFGKDVAKVSFKRQIRLERQT